MRGRWFAALLLLAGAPVSAAERYRTAGDCDGFPRIDVRTLPGLCVGLVAERLGFLRGVTAIGSDVYITDLGSRTPGRGRLLRLANNGRGVPEVVLDRLDRPNGVVPGPAGSLYVAEAGRIIAVEPRAESPSASIRIVFAALPNDGLHVLKSLALAADGALIVGVGSFSNNCETAAGGPPDPARPCPEQAQRPPRGSVLRVMPRAGVPVQGREAAVLATGLRNAAALAVLSDGRLLAAANARDAIDEADGKLDDVKLPHDTLVAITPGSDFGWPYCYDSGRPSPEYPRFDCATKRAPLRLLPPHAAPLALLPVAGDRLAPLRGKLLIAYHGYRAAGHRLVALDLDAPRSATVDVVFGWMAKPGIRPQGTPTALAQLPDGSVLIVEDHNRGLLRLAAVKPPLAP